MKVLFVSSGNSVTFPIAPFIKSQGESLKRNGIDLDYFTISGKGITGYLKNIRSLKHKVIEYNPDIIHVHYSLSGWISIFAKKRKPMVLSLMGSDVHGGNTRPFINLLLRLQVILIQLFNIIIILKSKNLSNAIWAKNKCKIIPNGVNYDIFKPIEKNTARKNLNLDDKYKYLLFVANPNDSNKNFALLKDALNYMHSNDVKVLTPFPVSHNKLPEYYSACDLLIFPSLKEGSPNVIKEALACNTRIIATPCGDIRELTIGLDSVIICEYDSKKLADKIDEQLLNNDPVQSREKVRDIIDEEIIAKKLVEVYNEIV